MIGFRFELTYGLTVGGFLAFALAPVWLPRLANDRWTLRLCVVAVAAVGSGIVLTQINSLDHTQLTNDLVARSVAVIQLVACVGALLWAASMTSVTQVAVAFAIGLAASIPFNVSADPNLWRFTLSIPLGVLALTLVSVKDNLALSLAVIGLLAVVGLLNDSRSNSAFLLLTGVVLIWQRLAARGSRRARGWGGVLALASAAALVAMLLQSAILEGYFGEVTQQRTAAQIERSGSALLGGRPEIAASIALITRYPFGLGAGLKANYEDIQAAKTAMRDIGYDPNNGYVERFMFGSGVELHSVTGNLWVWFGLVGAVFTAGIAVLLIVAIKRGYVIGALTPVFIYISLRAFWDILFSPFASALRLWPLVIALAVIYVTVQAAAGSASLQAFRPARNGGAV